MFWDIKWFLMEMLVLSLYKETGKMHNYLSCAIGKKWCESSWKYGMGEEFSACATLYTAMWLLEPTWVSTARDSLWVFCVSRTNKLQNLQDVSIGALKGMVAQATNLQISFTAGLRPGWWLWKAEIRRRFLIYLVLLTFQMANGSWIRARIYVMWHRFSPSITVFFLIWRSFL